MLHARWEEAAVALYSAVHSSENMGECGRKHPRRDCIHDVEDMEEREGEMGCFCRNMGQATLKPNWAIVYGQKLRAV